MSSAPAAVSSSTSEMARANARVSLKTEVAVICGGHRARDEMGLERWPPSSFSAGQELTGNYETLNLAGPFANRRQLHVAEIFLGGIVLHETVAAVDLDAIFRGADRDLARIQLGDRRFERGAAAFVLHRRGTIRQQAGRPDAGRVF